MVLEWPQVTVLACMVLACAIQLVEHGKPRGVYNFPLALFCYAIEFFILWQGGFFS